MNTTLRTNIKLLISTLRTASLHVADDAVRKIEEDKHHKNQKNDLPVGDEQ